MKEVDAFFEKGMREVRGLMESEGKAFVKRARESGDYRDRTGNLRRSNFYRVEDSGLVVGNTAEYASDVEARGFRVCSDEAIETERRLREATR